MKEQQYTIDDTALAQVIFGEHDQHILMIEEAFDVDILPRDRTLTFKGKTKDCERASQFVKDLLDVVKEGHPLSRVDVSRALEIRKMTPDQSLQDIFLDQVGQSTFHEPITPKTVAQKQYVDSIRTHDCVFSWGPAGTGKTYLAMAMAVTDLLQKRVDRIILTRPAVEAGEKLGFLPGNLAEKVNPYLRPLYDALHDMMDFERAQRLLDRGIIEVAPLAFMRGRTLNKSFVILDEAQNTTPEQMKMFLTRLGYYSKAVITGDVTQIDLPTGKQSGLVNVIHLLRHIPEIDFVEFSERDVVRHPLVQKIVRAYEAAESSISE